MKRQTAERNDFIFDRFRSIARSYFRKAHGVLLLYDVTSENSFLSVRAWVDQVEVTAQRWPKWPGWTSFSFLCFSAGLHGEQNPHVRCWKQGGPARAASRGQLCQHSPGRKAGQGVLRFLIRVSKSTELSSPWPFFAPQAYGALFCETSAKDGTNIVEAVLHLAR